MKNTTKLFILSCLLFSIQISGAQDIPLQTRPDTDQSNNIRNYLMKEAAEISGNALAGINSLEYWKKIRPQRYNEFLETIGIEDMPPVGQRSELNVKITGIIHKEGYRIEKLYYESLPGLYVPANLYIPDNIKEPVPAILYVCGHSREQKVYYQTYPRKFAQLGFVCLIIETIQYGEVLGEHHGCYARGWFNWYSRGYTPAGVEVWNAIRGLDLLCERSEVDPERLGVTGRSGGGAQSWFIAAADPRIKVVAPAAGATTLNEHILTRSIDRHCDCMVPINTFCRDFQDIGALIAPMPLMIVQGNGDNLNPIEGVRELYKNIRKVYDLYGAHEKIVLVEYPGGHASIPESRKTMFSFFVEHLMGEIISIEDIGDYDDSPEIMLTAEELKVYVDRPPDDDRTTTIQDSFIQLPAAPEISNEEELLDFRDSVKHFLINRSFNAFPEIPASLKPHLVSKSADIGPYGNHVYSIVAEEGWRLKVDIRWRNDPDTQHPLMIVLRNQNENRNESERFIDGLDDEWNIAYLEVRGVGETGWDPGLQWHIRRASAWTGRTIASMQVYDLLRCMEFCRALKAVDPEKIGIAARDEMGVVALYAALLDGNCHTVILKNPPESQDLSSRPDGSGAASEILNCLKVTDVYQLPALIPATNITFKEPVPDSYLWSEKIRRNIGAKEFIRIVEE
jgi:cephalosporin-C deacetylase-like acetyl esterase